MMKEGASAPPCSVSMTVNPILSTNCATKQTTTTNERKEGKKEERKDDTFCLKSTIPTHMPGIHLT